MKQTKTVGAIMREGTENKESLMYFINQLRKEELK